jgi:hypothetical protein
MISLILGQTADFISPLYIGRITTVIEKGEFDKVGPIVWELFAIVFVSQNPLSKLLIGRWNFRGHPRSHLQRHV